MHIDGIFQASDVELALAVLCTSCKQDFDKEKKQIAQKHLLVSFLLDFFKS
uniref:Uncharacterized protein n=1 Tax=Rhizophora mucronata TaxID=61149 RepID=A0A2P2PRH9_RHIMU